MTTQRDVVFQPTDTTACVDIPITDDNDSEQPEFFTVGFVPDDSGSFVIGNTPTSTITIVDDDGKANISCQLYIQYL